LCPYAYKRKDQGPLRKRLAARGRGRDRRSREAARSLSRVDACNPLLQAHPTWARDEHEGRGISTSLTPISGHLTSPLRARPRVDPSGLGHAATFTRRLRDPRSRNADTLGRILFFVTCEFLTLSFVGFLFITSFTLLITLSYLVITLCLLSKISNLLSQFESGVLLTSLLAISSSLPRVSMGATPFFVVLIPLALQCLHLSPYTLVCNRL
jgi:hypothetical protein